MKGSPHDALDEKGCVPREFSLQQALGGSPGRRFFSVVSFLWREPHLTGLEKDPELHCDSPAGLSRRGMARLSGS